MSENETTDQDETGDKPSTRKAGRYRVPAFDNHYWTEDHMVDCPDVVTAQQWDWRLWKHSPLPWH